MPRTVLIGMLTMYSACTTVPIHAQARNANLLGGCWLSFNAAGVQTAQYPQGVQPGILSISDPSAQLYLTAGGVTSSATIGIMDGAFQPIANHPPLDTWLLSMSHNNAIFIPVPGYPDRMFLFFHRIFSVDVRKFGWLEIGPDGPGGQLRMTDVGLQYFILDPADKCTGIAHANGEDYWFVTQAVGTNEIHAFRIGDLGVEEGPVISLGGVTLTDQYREGFMVASVQGDQLVSFSSNPNDVGNTFIELYDFDPLTGGATMQHTFEGLVGNTWGVEFSPSGQYLYLLVKYELPNGPPYFRHSLYQYDLDQQDIEASRVLIDTRDADLEGAQGMYNNLYLGSDGKIYGNRFPIHALSCIQAPDEAGTNCAYLETLEVCSDTIIWVPHPMKYYHDDAPLGIRTVNNQPLHLTPNPIEDHGVLSGVADGTVVLRWCDALGRVVQEERTAAVGGHLAVDARALATGQYILSLTQKSGVPSTVRLSVLH